MRWTRAVGRGMQSIYSLASVEHEAGQWSQIECTQEDQPCGKCVQCRNNDDMARALEYLSVIIQRHKLGTDED